MEFCVFENFVFQVFLVQGNIWKGKIENRNPEVQNSQKQNSRASWNPLELLTRSGYIDLAEYQLQSSHHVRFQDHVENSPGLFAKSAHCKSLMSEK